MICAACKARPRAAVYVQRQGRQEPLCRACFREWLQRVDPAEYEEEP